MHSAITIIFGLLIFAGIGHAMRRSQRLPLPIRVSVPQRTPGMVMVTWEQPNGVEYVRFSVSVRPPSAEVDEPLVPDQTYRNIRGLKPGTRYVVGIRGFTDNGRQSPRKHYPIWSEPLPPSNLHLEIIQSLLIGFTFGEREDTYSVDTVGVKVDWEESPSATSMSGYTVQMTPHGGLQTFPQQLAGVEDDDTTRIFVGLIPGEEYTFTVRTHIGPSYSLVYSSSISQTTRIPPEKPLTVREGTVGSTHATIRIIGPLIGIYSSLSLELSPNHGDISQGMPDPDDLTHDLFVITNLTPNTEYTLDVYSVSHGVRSIMPVTITFTTAPEPPVSLQVTSFTTDSINLQWDHPNNVLGLEQIEYIIEYQDMMGRLEIVTERLTVDNLDTRVHVSIQELEPGTTYCFFISTVINGSRSEVAEAIQTLVPLQPELSHLNGTSEGVWLKVKKPIYGRCPQVSVSYSPPLPGQETNKPQLYNIMEAILISGLPRNEKYTIQLRCVSNYIEGLPLIVSSRAQRNDLSEVYEDVAPRTRLPCSLGGRGNATPRTPRVDFIAPDACCGSRPFHTVNQECCGTQVRRITDDVQVMLCCTDRFYSIVEEVCCGSGMVKSRAEGCTEDN